MTGRASLTLVTAILVAAGSSVGTAQSRVSLGMGTATVRYSGGTRLSSLTFSPGFEVGSNGATFTGAGALASLPLNVWALQGRSDLWVTTPSFAGKTRLAAELIGAGTTRTDGGWTAAAHVVGEILWADQRWGIAAGLGPSRGWIDSEPSVTALHTRLRTWMQRGAVTYAVNVEPTRFLGAWFTDVTAGLGASSGRVNGSLYAVARLSGAYGSKATAAAMLQVFPTRSLALELGVGGYLSDPYQGLPRARYVAAGIRWYSVPRLAPHAAATPGWSPLHGEMRGDSVLVRFRMDGAKSVAIAGDWNGWQPQPLQSSGDDVWIGTFVLAAGAYHFTLLVDGSDWVVPSGIAVQHDPHGGLVALLVVP